MRALGPLAIVAIALSTAALTALSSAQTQTRSPGQGGAGVPSSSGVSTPSQKSAPSASSGGVQSTNTYISGTGSDAADCSQATPCKSLQVAVDRTAPGGQVFALNSANFGPLTLNKSITIKGSGVVGVLAPKRSFGLSVNTAPTDRVILQNLEIDGAGSGTDGLSFQGSGGLELRDSIVRGFNNGINFRPNGNSSLLVDNTSIYNNSVGVTLRGGLSGTVLGSHLINNKTGLTATGTNSSQIASVTIQNAVVSDNKSAGVSANSYSTVAVINSTVSNNGVGLAATASTASISISDSSVNGNRTGWMSTNGGQISTSSNNTNTGNTTDVATTTTSPPPTETPPTTTPLTKDIVRDFGAKCDGRADDNAAFTAFNTWGQAQIDPVTLIIPSGSRCMFSGPGMGNFFAQGIKNLVVIGYGATLSDNNGLGNGFFLGGRFGVYGDNLHSARVETVAAGAASVRLKNTSDSTKFVVGNWALVAGLDLMGYGYPPNPAFFEYVKVTNINQSTGDISFAAPLRNEYKSTWPSYSPGLPFEADQGGPATLYAIHPTWDIDVEYRGLTISQAGQTYAMARRVTYRDVTVTGGAGIIPTQNETWQCINCTMTNVNMEVDKIVRTMVLKNSTIRRINFQSSSVDDLIVDGTTVTDHIYGTPKRATISNSVISELQPGISGYGAANELTCNNCVIQTLTANSGVLDTYLDAQYTMTNGVIAVPRTTAITRASDNGAGKVRLTVNSTAGYISGKMATISGVQGTTELDGLLLINVVDGTHLDLPTVPFAPSFLSINSGYVGTTPIRWAVPGSKMTWAGLYTHQPSAFTVLDVTQDNANTYIHTSLQGSFPPLVVPGGALRVDAREVAVPKFTCSPCSGSVDAIDLSGAPPGIPLWSFSKRTYTANTPRTLVPVWGTLVSIKVNVIKPYTGSSALTFGLDSPFVIAPDGRTRTFYDPLVNVKIAGERVITPTGISGTRSGDNLGSPPGRIWLLNNQQFPRFSANVSTENQENWPVVTIELVTDQDGTY